MLKTSQGVKKDAPNDPLWDLYNVLDMETFTFASIGRNWHMAGTMAHQTGYYYY